MTSPNLASIPVPFDYNSFVKSAPAFANEVIFTPDAVLFWLTVATTLLNQRRWGTTFGLAVLLFVEHNLALEALAQRQSAAGVPGLSTGVISATAAKSVSVGYDTASSSAKDAGHWNLTTYGTRLVWLMGMFGAGPIQCGTGPSPFSPFFFGWTGDPCGPGWR